MLQGESSLPSTSTVSADGILTLSARRVRRHCKRKGAEKPPKLPKSVTQPAREYRQERNPCLRMELRQNLSTRTLLTVVFSS